MDNKDRVFARFKDDKPAAQDRRELLTIPRRAGAAGSRVVEVVHVRSGGAIKERPRRIDTHVRAASRDAGFPAKQAAVAPAILEPITGETVEPTAHVMPAWEPAAAAAEAPSPAPAPAVEERRGQGRPRKQICSTPTRRVADPFNAADDGANCIRCGYAIEAARERRGFMTHAECG